MEFVFFIYGLAFFILGFAITLYPKKRSEFKVADHLCLIAGFGLLHGINEWLDLFIMISSSPDPVILEMIRAATLPASFICLIQFGAKAIPLANEKLRAFRFCTPVFFILWLAAFLLSSRTLLMWDIWSRYLLCVPGASLTAWGLLLQLPEFKKTKFNHAIISLQIAAVAFFCYAVIAGLVVKEADFFPASALNYGHFIDHLGIPVQVFRSICALTMACGIIRALGVFQWETRTKLHESELKFQTVAAEAPVIIFIADTNSTVTFVEGKGLELIGLTSDMVLGRTIGHAFPDAAGIVENCKRALDGEEIVTTEQLNSHFFEVCLSPYTNRQGKKEGVIGVAVDVTRQTNTQRELENYRDEMARIRQMATLGAMGETMARQLGEPLALTRLFLQRLNADPASNNLSEGLAKKLKDSLIEVSHAIKIIDKFYSAAQIAPKATAEPIDLYQTVRRIFAVFAKRARQAGLELTTIGTDIVPCMTIPSKQLEQIFFILIQNAIDAAREGKKNKLIIKCSVENRRLELRFIDNCGHIPAESLQNIFEPFFKTENQSKDTGFGLAIARRILQAYNGSIEVESQKDRSTTFHVTLPAEHVY